MIGKKARSKVDVHISFEKDQSSKHAALPAFGGDDDICGIANFYSNECNESMRYNVIVRGTVVTTVQNQTRGSLNATFDTSTYTSLLAKIFDGPAKNCTAVGSSCHRSVPFKFNLQNDEGFARPQSRSHEPGSAVQQLLPTTDTESETHYWKNMFKPSSSALFSITYKVIATTYLKDVVLGSCVRLSKFIPSTETPPPFPVEDFVDEYRLRASRTLKTAGQRIGVMSSEPSPVALGENKGPASTSINLFFMVFVPHGTSSCLRALPRECQITARLQSTTFVSPRRRRVNAPILHGPMGDGDMVVDTKDAYSRKYTRSLHQWQIKASGSQEDDVSSGEDVYSMTLSLPFDLNDGQKLLSSFCSPVLSRRYAVDLAISFDRAASKTKLRLPLQLFHALGS